MAGKLIVLADLGQLRVYRISRDLLQTTPSLELVADMEFIEAHGRFMDRYTDQAGRFPVSGQSMAIGEKHNLGLERERRLIRVVAETVDELLQKEEVEFWSFAASPEINERILEQLNPELRRKLVRNLPHDLVKAGKEELLERLM